jgi:hypothetical protein
VDTLGEKARRDTAAAVESDDRFNHPSRYRFIAAGTTGWTLACYALETLGARQVMSGAILPD